MEYGAAEHGESAGAASAPRWKPLDVGQKLDTAINLSMREFWTLMKAVLLLLVPLTVVTFLITVSTLPDDFTTSGAFEGGTTAEDPSAGYIVGQLLVQLLEFLAIFLTPVVCFRAVSAAYLGDRVGWRESVRYAFRRFWAVVGVASLIALALGGVFVVGIFLIAFAAAIAPFFGVIMGLAILAGMIYGTVTWSLALPALFLEEIGVFAALGRSHGLIKGSWWHTFVTFLMAVLLALFIALLAVAVLVAVTFLTNDESNIMAIVLETLANLVASAITAPFLATIMVVVYLDRRVRKEALDLELVVKTIGGRPAAEALPRKRAPWVPVPVPPQPAWGGAPAWGQPPAPPGWGQPPQAPAPPPAWGQPPAPPPAWGQPQAPAPQPAWGQPQASAAAAWDPPAPPEPPNWDPPAPPEPPDGASS